MDALSGSVAVKFNLAASKTRDVGTVNGSLVFTKQFDFTYGDGASQLKTFFDDDRSLAAGANEELDLAGVLTDLFGDTITFNGVKVFYIENKSTTETLTIGGAASNPWEPWAGATGDTYKIGPGACDLKVNPAAAGLAVTAGTADKLKILNSGGAITIYRIVLAGDLA